MCVPPVGTHSARRLLPAWCQQTAALDCAASARHTTRPCACAQVAQSAEQGTENPRVGGSIPPLGTNKPAKLLKVHEAADLSSIADRASRYPVSGTTGRRLRAEARNFSNAQDPGEAGIQSPLGPAKRSCKASYDEGTGGGAATSNRSPLDPS